MKKTLIRHGLILLLASTCATAFANPAQESMAATQAESLLNIPRAAFKENSKLPGQYIYLKPGVNLQKYTQIMIAPLVILEKKSGDHWQALVSDTQGEAAQAFQQSIASALKAQGLQITDKPGPNVVTLRMAVTHIGQQAEGFVVSDILPIKAVFNIARMAVGMQKNIVKISTMGQLEDAQSGQLLAASFALRQQSKSGNEQVTAQNLKEWFNSWSKEIAPSIAQALAAAHQANSQAN